MDWWGITVILVAGIAVVVYGYLDDRRKTRERDAALAAPPNRDIPRFAPTAEPPRYLSELEARTRPDRMASSDLSDQQRIDHQYATTRGSIKPLSKPTVARQRHTGYKLQGDQQDGK